MKAAIVAQAGQPPIYGDFRNPTPAPGKSVIKVNASSISHVTRGRAAGSHYSSEGTLPFVPGIDGVGVDPDGKRVYFLLPERPFGAMAEFSLVDDRYRFTIPDALSDEAAAAMAIPGMSSWAALVERAILRPGETVLVNGATGASGRLAIQIAKHLGAKKIIATGRQVRQFNDLRRLGADAIIALTEDREAVEQLFKHEFSQGVDIVLDYLWGPSAETLVVALAKASPDGVPVRFVQIGSIGGANINLPGAALRSTAMQLIGSGIGSVPLPKMLRAIQNMLEAAPAAGFEIATECVPLASVREAWSRLDASVRIVLVP